MICTSLQNKNINEIFNAISLPYMEMAEIRLDTCSLSLDEIDDLFSSCDIPLIATCRITESTSAATSEAKLIRAIQAGAAFVDIDIDTPAMMSKRIRREAEDCGTKLIRSYHNYNNCDSLTGLIAIAEKCINLGADIVKIVTTAQTQEDCTRVLSLYSHIKNTPIIAFCMGEIGKTSRIECLKKGAPFSYACINTNQATAKGQWTTNTMAELIYGNTKLVGYNPHNTTEQILTMPCSKSFAQRAIIAAALAQGESILHNYSSCNDNTAAINAAKSMGAKVINTNSTLKITGIGATTKCLNLTQLHTGESGFLTRLSIPILAELNNNPLTITGEKTLLHRPLKGAKDIMQSFGVELNTETIPLTITGNLNAGNVQINGNSGSQIISGLLYALALNTKNSNIDVNYPKSLPYIFITIDILKKFGIKIDNEMEGGTEFITTQDWNLCDNIKLHIKGGQQYKASTINIEKDWSAAANFMVAGAIFGKVAIEGLDTSSLQADLSIMDILMEANASMSQEEESGILRVQKAPLQAFNFNLNNCPDLFPIVSVLAAFCNGTSCLTGVSRLINKESNRAVSILCMLQQLGVDAQIIKDSFIIKGMGFTQRLLTSNLLKGGKFNTYHDHRIAMALKIAEFGANSPIELDDVECIDKSFPNFLNIYNLL